MIIKNIAIQKVELDDEFNHELLYNKSRAAGLRREYKTLIKSAISNGNITIEKYILHENIGEKTIEITEIRENERRLLFALKDYPNESEYIAASILYTLKLLDSKVTISDKGQKLEIYSDLYKVDIRSRIDDANAQPRLFFNKEKTAFISTNENIKNLVDILAVKDVTVYIIDVDYQENIMYAYKISRDEKYFEVMDRFIADIVEGAAEEMFKK